jgi:hypothetical protein
VAFSPDRSFGNSLAIPGNILSDAQRSAAQSKRPYWRQPTPSDGGSLRRWTMMETDYYWIVLCKNHRFHTRQNLFSPHKILLGGTDAYSSPPFLQARFRVKCDDCGEEHSYKPHDVLRLETEPPASFVAHPLFSEVPLSQERKPA